MQYAMPEPKYMILKEGETYTFSDIYNLPESPQNILAELGYKLDIQQLELPRFPVPASDFTEMQRRMYEDLPYISLNNETMRREFFVAPLLWKLLRYVKFQVQVEYPLMVHPTLRGILDYWLQADQAHMIVIEAKNGDMTRGFVQMASQLVALHGHVKSDVSILYGAVTLGDVWRFGALHRGEARIVQDADLFNMPEDIAELAAVLLGILGAK